MKTKLILSLSLLVISCAGMAESMCPHWPVVIIEKQNTNDKEVYIKVSKDLIKEQKLLAGREMQISSSFTPYIEIKGNEVEVSLVHKAVGKQVDEQWTKFASITHTEIMGEKVCHKVTLEKGISISEFTESFRPDCGIFPAPFCKKEHQSKLKITKVIDGRDFYTNSLTGLLISR